jgi:hypothetical protein
MHEGDYVAVGRVGKKWEYKVGLADPYPCTGE